MKSLAVVLLPLVALLSSVSAAPVVQGQTDADLAKRLIWVDLDGPGIDYYDGWHGFWKRDVDGHADAEHLAKRDSVVGGYGAGYRGYGGYRKTYGSGYYGGFSGGSKSGYYGGRGGVAQGGGGIYKRGLELDSVLQPDLTKRAVETVDAVTEPVMDPAAVSASEPVGAAAEPAEAYPYWGYRPWRYRPYRHGWGW
ncbi:hypothetical protein DMC30DRAFT_400966 [Rhodotorula diobovata]|uniref:Uncharacterized protein n=1 Tax=Rhodotorula diobovata TaxID=5288 RepID=A0A5C5FSL0_9BASI|nr:hypothetical protein DMC30DRAFT_400966 [Rhodotorula diobovata]